LSMAALGSPLAQGILISGSNTKLVNALMGAFRSIGLDVANAREPIFSGLTSSPSTVNAPASARIFIGFKPVKP
jgi:hypothetical protein